MDTLPTGALTAVDFVPGDGAMTVLWLASCRAQFAAQAGTGTWADAAECWAAVARACPDGASQDRAIYWTMAGQAQQRARRTT